MMTTAPRGAIWFAEAFAFYYDLARSLYERFTVKVDARILEANRVRRIANEIEHQHPSMAKELYAAADRHESAVE